MVNIGKNIRLRRDMYDLTQADLAKRVGVTREAISSYEGGYKIPSLAVAVKMAEAFNCKIDDLIW